MWTILNRTPFAVGGTFACDRDGYTTYVVAVRGTFAFNARGRLTRLREQVPVSRAPMFEDAPTTSSLRCDNDLPYAKSATDVVLRGSAHAPGGTAVRAVDVSFRLGALTKTLRVHGERVWQRGGAPGVLVPSRARPFTSMPIGYERSFGGTDTRTRTSWPLNPVGRGFAADSAELVDALVPNVEDLREPIESSRHRPQRVAGFGPIASHWQQRAKLAGTYDERWKRERAPLWPEDFNPLFFQCAPADQQVQGFLRGGEACALHNLTPEGMVRFELPKLRLSVQMQFKDGNSALEAVIHTVAIDADTRQLTIVWHAAQRCHGREHKLQQTVVRREGDQVWVEAPST